MTKEAQRAELHQAILRIANDLRGSVDGWDVKQYVLGMLFYRFDASAQFVRGGNKNKLAAENQQAVLEAFIARTDAEHFARLVDNSEIAENDYNLSVTSYVEEEDTTVAVDIVELNAEIARIVARQQELRPAIDEIVAELEGSAQ